MKVRLFYILLGCMLLFVSCQDAFIPGYESQEPPLVVEGWIDSGYPPVVFVSSAMLAFDEGRATDEKQELSVFESILRHAKVTVECDGESFPLTCRYSDSYLTKFYFTTYALRGEVGKTYSLRVEYKGRVATSSTTIPEPAEIKAFGVGESDVSEGLYSIYADISNNMTARTFYKFFVWNTSTETCYSSSYSETFSNEGAGPEFRVRVKGGVHLPDLEADVEYHKGDVVKIKLATMDEEGFDFWKDYDQNAFCLKLPIISVYRNNVGNVSGALGYWVGYGINEYTVCID